MDRKWYFKIFCDDQRLEELPWVNEKLQAALILAGSKEVRNRIQGAFGITFRIPNCYNCIIDFLPRHQLDFGALAFAVDIPETAPENSESEFDCESWFERFGQLLVQEMKASIVLSAKTENPLKYFRSQAFNFSFEEEEMQLWCGETMFPKLCLVFGIGVTENDPSAIFHSENGCFGIKDWREFGLAATQIWKKFEPHSPRDLAFDQTVLFDPAYFSFIGRTQLRQEDNALLDRISLMITKEGSSFALAPQPIANANRELVLSHGIRRLFREHSVEHIHDFFHELFEGGPDQSISDPVAARLTYYSLGQVALIDSDNSLILANCESDDHGTWLALIFPNAVEGLHDTTIFKKTLMELSDFLEISYGLGSYGESYRILPTHAHKLEDAPFSLSVLKSGSNWSFKD